MNYFEIYTKLMLKRKTKPAITGYTEKHHIVPKCLGGDDTPSNIVRLTGREHFVAHKLLSKAYPENVKLFFAVYQMSIDGRDRKFRVTAREYESLKERFSISQTGDNNPAKRVEVREKMSASKLGKESFFKGKVHSFETKKKMSEDRKGIYVAEQNPMYGTRPWDTGSSRSSPVSQSVWKNAEEAYKLFLQGMSHKAIERRLNMYGTNNSSFIKMVQHFRAGWNPSEDEEWRRFTFEINPYKDIS